jgi:hypothetical protein
MKTVILWLLFIIAATCAWEEDYEDEYACGVDCWACPTGQHCESGNCVCDNTPSSCGAPGLCVACKNSEQCSNGACTCPNTANACSTGSDGHVCTPCTGAGEVCDGGVCKCPNTYTLCGTTNCTSCINKQICDGTLGACTCPNTANACSTGSDGDVCTPCTGTQICLNGECVTVLGCSEISLSNYYPVVRPSVTPWTPLSCLAACGTGATAYYSLIYTPFLEDYQCICYSAYIFTAPIANDNPCPIAVNGFPFGEVLNEDYGPPSTEFVYVA